MTKTMKQWAVEIHLWANNKGWWSRPSDTIAGKLLLIHSEVSEAAEELRLAKPCPKDPNSADVDWDDLRTNHFVCGHDPICMNNNYGNVSVNVGVDKPEGFPSELADILIRVFDMCGRLGIDPDAIVREKMIYNHTREQRHGGKGL